MRKRDRTQLSVAIAGNLFVGLLLVSAGCSSNPEAAAAVSANAAATNAVSTVPPAAADPPADAVPHGDHNPHHGGIVFMHGETHFEVVLARDGRYRVYFSDAVRADLPASVVSNVSIAVSRPGNAPETLPAHVDEAGECWVAEGRPVGSGEASARIAFTSPDGPYWIDTPFLPPTP